MCICVAVWGWITLHYSRYSLTYTNTNKRVYAAALLLEHVRIKSDKTLKWILPVWSESGDNGRDRVGDGVPMPRLFLLLLRQLEHKQGTRKINQRDVKLNTHLSTVSQFVWKCPLGQFDCCGPSWSVGTHYPHSAVSPRKSTSCLIY